MDECSANLPVCHNNANCVNNIGSYSCTCHVNYYGDGKYCVYKRKFFLNLASRVYSDFNITSRKEYLKQS